MREDTKTREWPRIQNIEFVGGSSILSFPIIGKSPITDEA